MNPAVDPMAELLADYAAGRAYFTERLRQELGAVHDEAYAELHGREAVVVAPATADFLAKLHAGTADTLLHTLCLASEAPLAVAPAMNEKMWADAATQANSLIASYNQRN